QMRVKVQGLLNAARYIEELHGQETLGEIVRACSPEVRETYTTSIAINWHPVEELTELVEVAAVKLGRKPTSLAQDIGAAGARAPIERRRIDGAAPHGRSQLAGRGLGHRAALGDVLRDHQWLVPRDRDRARHP